MNSFILDRKRFGVVSAAFALLLATVLAPLAMAAQVTERSIELSSSVASAPSVSYNVAFTAATNSTGAFAIDFCTTPNIGAACTTPAGLDVPTAPAISTESDHTVSRVDGNTVKVVLDASVDAGDPVLVDIAGITNPSATGPFYARIVTYEDGTTNYHYVDAANLDAGGAESYLDEGAVAISITGGFNVSGSVLESLVFCATDNASTILTGCTGTLGSPNLELGTDGVLTTAPSEGTIKTQISTNAAGGVVVNLKSNAIGGGLIRAGAATSEITPLNTLDTGDVPFTALATNSAKFGLKLAGLGSGIAASGDYSTDGYYLDYAAGNATGVTSVYGSPIFNASGVVNDGTANLTFAATSSNTTPAGTYAAPLNLIATGKF